MQYGRVKQQNNNCRSFRHRHVLLLLGCCWNAAALCLVFTRPLTSAAKVYRDGMVCKLPGRRGRTRPRWRETCACVQLRPWGKPRRSESGRWSWWPLWSGCAPAPAWRCCRWSPLEKHANKHNRCNWWSERQFSVQRCNNSKPRKLHNKRKSGTISDTSGEERRQTNQVLSATHWWPRWRWPLVQQSAAWSFLHWVLQRSAACGETPAGRLPRCCLEICRTDQARGAYRDAVF